MSRRRAVVAALALAGLVPFAPAVRAAPAGGPFSDVPADHWAVDEIIWATTSGYLPPLSATRFQPHRAMSRAQAVRMLWRASGSPVGYPEHGLDDVRPWLDAAVRWSVSEHVATGLPGGHFRPATAVRRGQLVSWLWSLDGQPVGEPATLVDVAGRWFEDAARWAVGEGIASGYRGRRFDGAGNVRRDQAAVWLAGWDRPRTPEVELTAELSDTNLVSVHWTVRNGLRHLSPTVDVEPLVGRRPTSCTAVGRCSSEVRTSRGGVNRFTITAANTEGDLVQASTDLVVPRPPPPVVDEVLHRIDPFAAPAEAQTLSWDPPVGVSPSPPTSSDYIKVRRSTSIFALGPELPLDGTFALTGGNRAGIDPVSWSLQYCREPVVDAAVLCSFGKTVTFDPRRAVFDAPFRRFVVADEDLEVSWSGPSDHWVVDAPTLGVAAQEVTSPSITVPAEDVAEGVHAVTVRGCHGPCAPDPDHPVDDRIQVVVGLDDERPHWSERSIEDDFTVDRRATTDRWSTGVPLDVAFGADGDLWSVGEFGRDLLQAGPGPVTHLDVPYARRTSTDGAGIVQFDRVRPFGNPLGTCTGQSSETSAAGERVIWTGDHVWFTQGGVTGAPCATANHSRLVRFDPAGVDDPYTAGDDRFCAVHVPGNDNNVVGVAYDPSHDRVWFSELDLVPDLGHGAVGWFDEDEVACDNALDYEDPGAVASASAGHACGGADEVGCIHRIDLALPDAAPPTTSHPTQLTVDEASGSVWVADLIGAVLTRVPLDGVGDVEQFPLPAPAASWSFFGAYDWQLRATDDAVYLVEYGDNQVLRFDTTAADLVDACGVLVDGANPCVRQVFLPVGASTVNAHSLALDGDRLWFTVANEAGYVRDPTDALLGHLDLSTWTEDEAPDGVLYTDLDALGDLPERDHRSPRGIDVDADGRVALAELGGEIDVLTPH